MKFSSFLAGFLFLAFIFSPNQAIALQLDRNLSLGDSGSDVLFLQQFLNTDPDTTILGSGVGSQGQETTYFGELTKQAVIKFQNKYTSEVLTPVGLLSGNGFVGPLTRQKIAQLGEIDVVSSQNTTTSNQETIDLLVKQVEVLTFLLKAEEESQNLVNLTSISDSNNDSNLNSLSQLQSQISQVPQFNSLGASSVVGALTTPFGGQILAMFPCFYPVTGYVVVLGPPTPGMFVYQAGLSFSYKNGPPTHPGQWLLGVAGPNLGCYTARRHGDWKDFMSGTQIIFHGSSI